jgi:hypothetical protein
MAVFTKKKSAKLMFMLTFLFVLFTYFYIGSSSGQPKRGSFETMTQIHCWGTTILVCMT